MSCYLKCKVTPNWMDDEYEWTRRIHSGQIIKLGKNDMPYGFPSDDMDLEQVVCRLDIINKVILVTRIGKSVSKDSCHKEIGAGETVEIGDGQWFSVSGKEDGVLVSFERDENDSDEEQEKGDGLEGEVFYKGCWYSESSHSLLREKMRDEEHDDDDDVQE